MTGRVVVVGLGPGGPDLVTAGTLEAIERIDRRFLRTVRHPSAPVVGDRATAFDGLYERASNFDDVYQGIVDALVVAAEEHGEVLYAVPGSPRVAERSVDLLCRDPRVEVTVLPALSFLDLAWVRLGIDPLAAGVRVVDGRAFSVDAAGSTGPLLVAQCDARHVLSEIKLAVEDAPEEPVIVLAHLGLPDEQISTVAWHDLDRLVDPDHLTSLYVPALGSPVAAELVRFDEQVRILRAECPWDAEQTHESLRKHLLEETYEVLEAIDAIAAAGSDGAALDAAYVDLEEELGDLLYQIFFHAVLAAENGRFTMADVARGVHDKLERRHPHVFGDLRAETSDEVLGNWEIIKRAEKRRASRMDGIPSTLPGLAFAAKVLGRAGDAVVDVPVSGDDDEIAQALLEIVRQARERGIDAEDALRRRAVRIADAVRAAEPGAEGGAGASPAHD